MNAQTICPIPLELLELIASDSPEAWISMTAIPDFGRYTITEKAKFVAFKAFFTLESEGEAITSFYKGKIQSFGKDPARIENRDGSVIKSWWKAGKLHRDGELPAMLVRDKNGIVERMEWYYKDQLHREKKPAVIVYINSSTKTEKWYNKGVLHRIDGPAVTNYYNGGILKQEEWFKDGEKWEENPYLVTYYRNGAVYEERTRDGPFCISKVKYSKEGKMISKTSKELF